MLDRSHPQTVHILAAGRLEGLLLDDVKTIISIPESERERLLTHCEQTINRMRTLNLAHFGNSRFIAESLDDLQSALRKFMETERPHLDMLMPILEKLRSVDGFRTAFM